MELAIHDGGKTVNPQGGGALVEVEQQRAIAETQAAMIIAKRFPRNQLQAEDRIKIACSRPGLAESALYAYARGGTDITGPSIRLAECIAQAWGNLQFGIRELESKNGFSTVEAFAWDIENNVRQVKVFQVEHKRHTKKGAYALEDPRDIYEMVANNGARRLRACILGIVPGDLVETAVKQCEQTLKSDQKITPERIQSMIEAFAKFKVTKEMVEARIQRKLDAITPALFVNLMKIYNSLKDGMSSPSNWFEVVEPPQDPSGGGPGPKSKTEALKDKLKGNQGPAPDPAPAKTGQDKKEGPGTGTAGQDPAASKTQDQKKNGSQDNDENQAPGESKLSDPEADFRAEWINKRNGFKEYVAENLELFKTCSPELRQEAIDKWHRIYGAEPCPFNGQASVWTEFDELQKKDPDGILEAVMAAGFSNEPGDAAGIKKVLEAYKNKTQTDENGDRF